MDKACSQCGEKGHDLRNCTSDSTFACTCDVKTPHANAVGCKKLALRRSKAELARQATLIKQCIICGVSHVTLKCKFVCRCENVCTVYGVYYFI